MVSRTNQLLMPLSFGVFVKVALAPQPEAPSAGQTNRTDSEGVMEISPQESMAGFSVYFSSQADTLSFFLLLIAVGGLPEQGWVLTEGEFGHPDAQCRIMGGAQVSWVEISGNVPGKCLPEWNAGGRGEK